MKDGDVLCGNCKAVLDEPRGLKVEDRKPCPNCGSVGRQFVVVAEAKLALRPPLGKV